MCDVLVSFVEHWSQRLDIWDTSIFVIYTNAHLILNVLYPTVKYILMIIYPYIYILVVIVTCCFSFLFTEAGHVY